MSDEEFRRLCNMYGFAPSRALRELIDCAVGQAVRSKPVAWIHTDPDKPNVKFLEWREDEPGYRGRWIKTPLYTARG